jgi:hypothetical protein
MLLRRTPELVIEETGAGGHVVEPNGGIRVGRAKEGGGVEEPNGGVEGARSRKRLLWMTLDLGAKEPGIGARWHGEGRCQSRGRAALQAIAMGATGVVQWAAEAMPRLGA